MSRTLQRRAPRGGHCQPASAQGTLTDASPTPARRPLNTGRAFAGKFLDCCVADGQGQVLKRLEKLSVSLSSGGMMGRGNDSVGIEVSSAIKGPASTFSSKAAILVGTDGALAQSPKPEAGTSAHFLNTDVIFFF